MIEKYTQQNAPGWTIATANRLAQEKRKAMQTQVKEQIRLLQAMGDATKDAMDKMANMILAVETLQTFLNRGDEFDNLDDSHEDSGIILTDIK